ncbi:MAG: OmpA family protein [Campylobacteraceae bacterium]|nr:OmpA family protein [Campylobacteraceae bacterium]
MSTCKYKKYGIPLALLALLLLIFLCTLMHTGSIYNELKAQNEQLIASKVTNVVVEKDNKGLVISGVFGSQEMVDLTKKKFALYFNPIKDGDIKIQEGVDDSKWKDVLDNLAYYFSNSLESGKLSYSKDGLKLSGETLNQGIKEDIDSVLNAYQDVEVVEDIKIIEPTTNEQKARKELYELLRVKKVEFENGKSTLKTKALNTLDLIADILKSDELLHVTIEGHTDNVGNKEFNEKLSLERANSVRNYLIERGISEDRLSVEGYGENKPVLPNTTEENKQKNRRVEFKIKGENHV